jgi:DNA repair protein RadC
MELHSTIKMLSPDERPREKLLTKGPKVLSDAELLALLIGTGTRNETAVDMARRILYSVNHDLQSLGAMKWKELSNFKGMGEAKAVTIVAALELAKRKMAANSKQSVAIRHSRDVYERLLEFMWNLPHEEFWMVSLSRSNRVISIDKVGEGGLSATVADPKKVFRIALVNNAASIIVAHNHPSGNLEPSNEDNQLTKRLVQSGQMLECPVLDHVIVTDHGYFSYTDEAVL